VIEFGELKQCSGFEKLVLKHRANVTILRSHDLTRDWEECVCGCKRTRANLCLDDNGGLALVPAGCKDLYARARLAHSPVNTNIFLSRTSIAESGYLSVQCMHPFRHFARRRHSTSGKNMYNRAVYMPNTGTRTETGAFLHTFFGNSQKRAMDSFVRIQEGQSAPTQSQKVVLRPDHSQAHLSRNTAPLKQVGLVSPNCSCTPRNTSQVCVLSLP
jgi:hypothetical protein